MVDETSDIVSVSRAHVHIVDRIHYAALLTAVDEAIEVLEAIANLSAAGFRGRAGKAHDALIEARKRVTG